MKLTASPSNTAVVTVLAYPEQVPQTTKFLVETANRVGIPIIRFGKGEQFVDSVSAKVIRLNQWISRLDEKFEYVLYVDARDVVFVRPLQAICDYYNAIGSLILMSSESDSQEFPVEHPQYPSGLNSPNTGCFIGHRPSLIHALNVISRLSERHAGGDKAVWQEAYVHGLIPLRVDHEQRVFVTGTSTLADAYDFERRTPETPLVMKNGSIPSVVHFTGDGACAIPFFVRAFL